MIVDKCSECLVRVAALTHRGGVSRGAPTLHRGGVLPRVHRVTGRLRARHAPPPPYVVVIGPASVGVGVDVDVFGVGVRVTRPVPGAALPVCGYGATPTTIVTPRCPAN
ncbi:MAG TPA: hypothetical protein VNE21_07005 [Mycobacteriales bacterium]|nr:hypothetical protein [Mycobacteriales bacterium]